MWLCNCQTSLMNVDIDIVSVANMIHHWISVQYDTIVINWRFNIFTMHMHICQFEHYPKRSQVNLDSSFWANLIGLKTPIVYTKSQSFLIFGTGNEDFKGFLSYIYGHGGHLSQRTETIWIPSNSVHIRMV